MLLSFLVVSVLPEHLIHLYHQAYEDTASEKKKSKHTNVHKGTCS